MAKKVFLSKVGKVNHHANKFLFKKKTKKNPLPLEPYDKQKYRYKEVPEEE